MMGHGLNEAAFKINKLDGFSSVGIDKRSNTINNGWSAGNV